MLARRAAVPIFVGKTDGDVALAEAWERIVSAVVFGQRYGAPCRGEGVGTQPVLPDDDRISRERANLLDEPAEMEGDLRIGGPIVGDGRLDGLGLAEIGRAHV